MADELTFLFLSSEHHSYRLGPFGFLNSSAMREAGFLPNNGLHDQKLALRWIQKYIRGFGGNPEQVTYLGSSMGASKLESRPFPFCVWGSL